jgi:hypothetical protein
VVDAFYVRGPDGRKLTEASQIAAVERAVEAGVRTSAPE